ncbi:SDR family oxidoreductase [Celeribacter baekdonensis]|uniref:SDR family oxidoreductase n=1 Tax=Celeribacter baekdonensis TaxID=875171 RepID=UPI0030DB555F|tara:strand:- start:176675 stop:177460 length:786 start_codon:yes stop_codon:yes gene_type:complete
MALKKALVTGGARRLGRAIALSLGQAGYDVAVHYHRSKDEADAVVAELQAMDVRAEAIQADLLAESEVQTLVPRAVEALGGPLTLLVNNASVFEPDEIDTTTRDSWDRHFESNLRAPFVLIQALAAQAPDPIIDEAGHPIAQALVVNMIDQRVRKLTPQFMSYTLAKSALWTLTQTAAQGLAPRVRVNAIGPGPTLKGARQSPEGFAAQQQATLLRRGSAPSDVTAALAYFTTSDAVTGQLICVDGGQHLAWETPDVLVSE